MIKSWDYSLRLSTPLAAVSQNSVLRVNTAEDVRIRQRDANAMSTLLLKPGGVLAAAT